MLELKLHGDVLERKYYEKVVSQFSVYEVFWQKFIGNDGKAEIIKSGNISIDSFREEIAQYSYTIFESVVCLYRIKFSNTKIETIEEYIEANNNFILFQTHCGRIRDCVGKLGTILGLKDLSNSLNDFYQMRNNVLHGKKIPFAFIDNFFALPHIEGENPNVDLWKDKLKWSEVSEKDLEFIDDIYENLYNTMLSSLNGIYSQILTCVRDKSNLKVIVTKMEQYSPSEDYDYTWSGMINNHSATYRLIENLSGSIGN
ncbi:MAG: hypothetical protein P9X24_02125 [Candidatus Hatepunaea meridiana]|nr:hypothetical protein [Candidatus Hatepunaea meridiana]